MDPLYWYYQEGMGPKHPGEHALLGKKKNLHYELDHRLGSDWAEQDWTHPGRCLKPISLSGYLAHRPHAF